MRGAGLSPEARLLGPIRFAARAHRDPDLDANLARVAAGGFGHRAQPGEDVERFLAWGIGVRHTAVAESRDALQRALVMAADPHRHPAAFRPRVDAGVIDRVPASLVGDVRLGPQSLHDLNLLLGATAAVVEILVQPDKLD